MTIYSNQTYEEERALYGLHHARLAGCRFAGEADGESALKETEDLHLSHCDFLLRYPLWHTKNTRLEHCTMTETCRAALWYARNVVIEHSTLDGIKAVRECENLTLAHSTVHSTEFGWFCRGLNMHNCELQSEYAFLHTNNLQLNRVQMTGKYSFQYVENAEIRNCVLDTKDAFWHGKNITVYDSVIKGEYLGWYSENLTFVRCRIMGTQPLCYAKNLVLEDCEMIDCDLSFERSEVRATVKGSITSVKNPLRGQILADHIGAVILDATAAESTCTITDKSALKQCC